VIILLCVDDINLSRGVSPFYYYYYYAASGEIEMVILKVVYIHYPSRKLNFSTHLHEIEIINTIAICNKLSTYYSYENVFYYIVYSHNHKIQMCYALMPHEL